MSDQIIEDKKIDIVKNYQENMECWSYVIDLCDSL
jgi:hypothetical protein